MTSQPEDPAAPAAIFDSALARTRLARAARAGFEGFLADRAAEDLGDRLQTLTRPFTTAVDLATPTDAACLTLNQSGRAQAILRLAPASALARAGDGVATLEALPLAKGSVDLVVSLLALQGANDLPGVLAQIRQALRPDGLLLACLLGGGTLSELRQCLLAAETELTGGASPRVAPFADVRAMGALMQRAGFALPVIDSETVTVRYDHVFGLMRDLRAMGLTNSLLDRSRRPTPRALFWRAAELYQQRFADADGRIRATFEMIWLSGWAPHESQQKPLRPGSARMKLADALGVPEQNAEGES